MSNNKEYQQRYYQENKTRMNAMSAQWFRDNRDKQRQYSKAWSAKNKPKIKKSTAMRNYGLTEEQYLSLLDHCEICGTTGDLVIDHDHSSNMFRGRLCRNCNLMIGHGGDSPDTLRLAADYLERHRN